MEGWLTGYGMFRIWRGFQKDLFGATKTAVTRPVLFLNDFVMWSFCRFAPKESQNNILLDMVFQLFIMGVVINTKKKEREKILFFLDNSRDILKVS